MNYNDQKRKNNEPNELGFEMLLLKLAGGFMLLYFFLLFITTP